MKKIFVTGGAGYIGTTLVPMLLERRDYVRVFDSLLFGGDGLVACFRNPRFSFVCGDVTDAHALRRGLDGFRPDAVVHLAAIVGYPQCKKVGERRTHEVNVGGTRNVRRATGRAPLVFASTTSVYGKLEDVCEEGGPKRPLTTYGRSKLEAEELLDDAVRLRLATNFGVSPRMRLDLLLNDFVYRAVKERNLVVYERGHRRGFVCVRDSARAIMHALDNFAAMCGQPFNVGHESLDTTKGELAEMVAARTDAYLHFADYAADEDQRDYHVCYERLAAAEGWRPTVSLEDGIEEVRRACSVLDRGGRMSNV
jgi:nucleoside-diphosphate-sugar epimerase